MRERGNLFGVVLFLMVAVPSQARAQFSDPCDVACGVTLVATAAAFGTGTAAAVGRMKGGFSTLSGGILTWTAGFTATTASGIALSGDGERQRRSVYGAGIGALGGALAGLGVGALVESDDGAVLLSGALIGAAAGVAIGGVIAALTYEENDSANMDMIAPLRVELLRVAW